MPLVASFIGPAYRTRSPIINNEIARNVFLETVESAGDAKKFNYYGTPGLTLQTTVTGKGRGMFQQDGRTWSVNGTVLYEYDTTVSPAVATPVGSVTDDGKPVFFASNGRGGEQLAIRSANELQIFDLLTNVLSGPIALPLTNAPSFLLFIDGYFILGERNSVRTWFSNLEDGTTWDALDFFARSNTSDNIVGGVVFRNRIWILGSQTGQVYYDSGDADNPFVPYPGSIFQEGVVSMWAVAVQGESVVWMAQDNEGKGRMVRATDYVPQVISTPAIAFAIAQYPTLADVELAIYEQEGHPFAIWTCPSGGDAGESWGWDAREQQWHQRSSYNEDLGQDQKWRVRGICSPGILLCGDWYNGKIYQLDMDAFTEDGSTIVSMRRAPYLSAENQWVFVDRLELGMQAGVGLIAGQGINPVVGLRVSYDGGHTFLFIGWATLGAQGEYETRAVWYKLGRARADRLVLEVFQSDPVRRVWGPGLWMKARPGTGAL
jgi:hypothetical protein